MPTVYADILFFINAGMDYLCFCLTARLLHRPLSLPRAAVGAAVGGVYAVLALLISAGRVASLFIDVGVCLLMCALVFGGRHTRVRGVLTCAGVYFLTSMILGGIMTALYSLGNRAGLAELLPSGEDGLSTWLFALLALSGGIVTLWGGRIFHRSGSVRACRVILELDGHTVTLDGMVDSGNLLRDPVGGRPVIVLDRGAVAHSLPTELLSVIDGGNTFPTIPPAVAARWGIRFIPTATAAGQSMLTAFSPNRLTLTADTPRGERTAPSNALIAVTTLPPAKGTEGTRYGALVPSELIPN